jgi:type II secretory pathway component PulF
VSEALVVARRVVRNRVFSSAIDALREQIRAGQDIASTARAGGVFPPMVVYMIAVGERGGRLEDMLRTVADTYEREVSISQQKLLALMEPAIIIFMAVVVAFIVAAVLLPILSLSDITF